jgi:hypothetical protein
VGAMLWPLIFSGIKIKVKMKHVITATTISLTINLDDTFGKKKFLRRFFTSIIISLKYIQANICLNLS